MRKTIFGIMLLMMLALSALSTFVFASQDGSSVTLVGCNVKDYRVVNGTIAITFCLRSDADIQHVIFRYENGEGLLTNVTMSLVEGNRNYGWWEANPIRPRMLEERVNSEMKYQIDASAMLLYVFVSNTVYEVPIPQNILPQLGSSTERVEISPDFLLKALLASSGGILLIAVVVAIKKGKGG